MVRRFVRPRWASLVLPLLALTPMVWLKACGSEKERREAFKERIKNNLMAEEGDLDQILSGYREVWSRTGPRGNVVIALVRQTEIGIPSLEQLEQACKLEVQKGSLMTMIEEAFPDVDPLITTRFETMCEHLDAFLDKIDPANRRENIATALNTFFAEHDLPIVISPDPNESVRTFFADLNVTALSLDRNEGEAQCYPNGAMNFTVVRDNGEEQRTIELPDRPNDRMDPYVQVLLNRLGLGDAVTREGGDKKICSYVKAIPEQIFRDDGLEFGRWDLGEFLHVGEGLWSRVPDWVERGRSKHFYATEKESNCPIYRWRESMWNKNPFLNLLEIPVASLTMMMPRWPFTRDGEQSETCYYPFVDDGYQEIAQERCETCVNTTYIFTPVIQRWTRLVPQVFFNPYGKLAGQLPFLGSPECDDAKKGCEQGVEEACDRYEQMCGGPTFVLAVVVRNEWSPVIRLNTANLVQHLGEDAEEKIAFILDEYAKYMGMQPRYNPFHQKEEYGRSGLYLVSPTVEFDSTIKPPQEDRVTAWSIVEPFVALDSVDLRVYVQPRFEGLTAMPWLDFYGGGDYGGMPDGKDDLGYWQFIGSSRETDPVCRVNCDCPEGQGEPQEVVPLCQVEGTCEEDQDDCAQAQAVCAANPDSRECRDANKACSRTADETTICDPRLYEGVTKGLFVPKVYRIEEANLATLLDDNETIDNLEDLEGAPARKQTRAASGRMKEIERMRDEYLSRAKQAARRQGEGQDEDEGDASQRRGIRIVAWRAADFNEILENLKSKDSQWFIDTQCGGDPETCWFEPVCEDGEDIHACIKRTMIGGWVKFVAVGRRVTDWDTRDVSGNFYLTDDKAPPVFDVARLVIAPPLAGGSPNERLFGPGRFFDLGQGGGYEMAGQVLDRHRTRCFMADPIDLPPYIDFDIQTYRPSHELHLREAASPGACALVGERSPDFDDFRCFTFTDEEIADSKVIHHGPVDLQRNAEIPVTCVDDAQNVTVFKKPVIMVNSSGGYSDYTDGSEDRIVDSTFVTPYSASMSIKQGALDTISSTVNSAVMQFLREIEFLLHARTGETLFLPGSVVFLRKAYEEAGCFPTLIGPDLMVGSPWISYLCNKMDTCANRGGNQLLYERSMKDWYVSDDDDLFGVDDCCITDSRSVCSLPRQEPGASDCGSGIHAYPWATDREGNCASPYDDSCKLTLMMTTATRYCAESLTGLQVPSNWCEEGPPGQQAVERVCEFIPTGGRVDKSFCDDPQGALEYEWKEAYHLGLTSERNKKFKVKVEYDRHIPIARYSRPKIEATEPTAAVPDDCSDEGKAPCDHYSELDVDNQARCDSIAFYDDHVDECPLQGIASLLCDALYDEYVDDLWCVDPAGSPGDPRTYECKRDGDIRLGVQYPSVKVSFPGPLYLGGKVYVQGDEHDIGYGNFDADFGICEDCGEGGTYETRVNSSPTIEICEESPDPRECRDRFVNALGPDTAREVLDWSGTVFVLPPFQMLPYVYPSGDVAMLLDLANPFTDQYHYQRLRWGIWGSGGLISGGVIDAIAEEIIESKVMDKGKLDLPPLLTKILSPIRGSIMGALTSLNEKSVNQNSEFWVTVDDDPPGPQNYFINTTLRFQDFSLGQDGQSLQTHLSSREWIWDANKSCAPGEVPQECETVCTTQRVCAQQKMRCANPKPCHNECIDIDGPEGDAEPVCTVVCGDNCELVCVKYEDKKVCENECTGDKNCSDKAVADPHPRLYSGAYEYEKSESLEALDAIDMDERAVGSNVTVDLTDDIFNNLFAEMFGSGAWYELIIQEITNVFADDPNDPEDFHMEVSVALLELMYPGFAESLNPDCPECVMDDVLTLRAEHSVEPVAILSSERLGWAAAEFGVYPKQEDGRSCEWVLGVEWSGLVLSFYWQAEDGNEPPRRLMSVMGSAMALADDCALSAAAIIDRESDDSEACGDIGFFVKLDLVGDTGEVTREGDPKYELTHSAILADFALVNMTDSPTPGAPVAAQELARMKISQLLLNSDGGEALSELLMEKAWPSLFIFLQNEFFGLFDDDPEEDQEGEAEDNDELREPSYIKPKFQLPGTDVLSIPTVGWESSLVKTIKGHVGLYLKPLYERPIEWDTELPMPKCVERDEDRRVRSRAQAKRAPRRQGSRPGALRVRRDGMDFQVNASGLGEGYELRYRFNRESLRHRKIEPGREYRLPIPSWLSPGSHVIEARIYRYGQLVDRSRVDFHLGQDDHDRRFAERVAERRAKGMNSRSGMVNDALWGGGRLPVEVVKALMETGRPKLIRAAMGDNPRLTRDWHQKVFPIRAAAMMGTPYAERKQ